MSSGHSDLVIAVDENDQPLGFVDKKICHTQNILHRAVSGFVFSENGALLVQQRAFAKYHSGGLWANSCCSHPRPDETALECITRRTREELGFDIDYRPFRTFRYAGRVSPEMYENEFVHLFWGMADREPRPDSSEVAQTRWLQREDIRAWMSSPVDVTLWFRCYFDGGAIADAFTAAAVRQFPT